jgi:hypothetical protein
MMERLKKPSSNNCLPPEIHSVIYHNILFCNAIGYINLVKISPLNPPKGDFKPIHR